MDEPYQTRRKTRVQMRSEIIKIHKRVGATIFMLHTPSRSDDNG